ncbi:hypothetical protein [Streptomyces sp. SID13031]|uniref:hypothetical protein n=1 Tax=Streptomyces sp. SID13031 TaxID=2706046 RepID=UPI0013CCBF10|nr:hypothetical protein [Streptomyces sp. SID13031]NEA37564.1 hypothetical protein [Streptomyces sp. SID13031]
MTKSSPDRPDVYDHWKRTFQTNGDLIENDGRLPEGTKVWTPLGEQTEDDIEPTYCNPAWGWYQGRILGQADTHWWFVYLGYGDLPSFCLRHFAELRLVVQDN